jgi:deoxyribodipyrimidine photolyase
LGYDPQKTFPTPFTKYNNGNSNVPIRELLPSPKDGDLPFPEKFEHDIGYLPDLKTFGFTDEEIETYAQESRADIVFKGGEDAALARVQHYVFDSKNIAHYAETRNNLMDDENG